MKVVDIPVALLRETPLLDHRHQKPIIILLAHNLHHHCLHPLILPHILHADPSALDHMIRLGRTGIRQTPLRDNIINHDTSTGPTHPHSPVEVGPIIHLIGIDEREVESLALTGLDLLLQPWKRMNGGPEDQIHSVAHAGVGDVLASYFGGRGFVLEGGDFEVGVHGGQPDGGAAAECPELDGVFSVEHLALQGQELADVGGSGDVGKTLGSRVLDGVSDGGMIRSGGWV